MLVYFGYTHCPDVCPATMANLGVALRQSPTIVQARTQVVFVTSDPARDTTPVMKAWLSHFDPGLPNHFVGLTASLKQIDTIARSVGVPLSPPVKERNGSISVQHGAQTLAFVDGRARVLWTAGTSPADYEHDIAKLAAEVKAA
jgi:protein SCO1/2